MPITDHAVQHAAMLGIRTQRLAFLEGLIQKFMERDERQAIVIKITRRGAVIFEGCYGENTKAYGVRPDTIFPVASITKPVVAALLLLLQEDGAVDICEPVCNYLPEFTGGGREKICIWHFLTHTSGINEAEMYPAIDKYVKEELGLTAPGDESTHEEWVAFDRLLREKMGLNPDAVNDRKNDAHYAISLKLPLNRPPRAQMSYCSYGFQRLKEIIDVVTGEQIDVFAQRKLFDPLGMKDTYWNVPESKWERILGRKETCMGAPWINTEHNYRNESGGGGLKTTAEDITNFCRMIINGGVFNGERILSRRSIAEMTKNHNAGIPLADELDVSFGAWGLGLNIRAGKKDDSGILRSPNCLDHGGWAGTKIMLDPDEDITVALFTAEYKESVKPNFNVYGRILNVLYAALE